MKGIILARDPGLALSPLTRAANKALLPVYDKPMIYYPLSTLMLSGIREILVVAPPVDLPAFRRLLGDGGDLGLRIDYAAQMRGGSAQALVEARAFIGRQRVCLAFADSIVHGARLSDTLRAARTRPRGATLLLRPIRHPRGGDDGGPDAGGGAAGIDDGAFAWGMSGAAPALSFYDSHVVDIAAGLRPSADGESTIAAVNHEYRRRGQLHVETLARGVVWLDTDSPRALLQASAYIQTLEHRQGLMVACPEEIAYRLGYITVEELQHLARTLAASTYGQSLSRALE